MKNRHGLDRRIPSSIKRQVRARSKFGCVVCRCGIYQYEHINPEFSDAKVHDPSRICCLCGKCHDKVTRKQLSKQAVLAAYEHVQCSGAVEPPREFFDFHTGEARLCFGSLTCDLSPATVFKCYDQVIFSLSPGVDGQPGAINAFFCDDAGNELFEIDGNEWIGPTSYFDLEIKGQRFTVRMPNRRIVLRLRLDPPGKIAIEQLDMRYGDVHLLASEHDLALGRYTGHGQNLIWMHVKARIDAMQPSAAAILITEPRVPEGTPKGSVSARTPNLMFNQNGEPERAVATDPALVRRYDPTFCGLNWPDVGFQVAVSCQFAFNSLSVGVCRVAHARRYFFSRNRVNAPSLFLPAELNQATLSEERQRQDSLRPKAATKMLREPFLVQKDQKSIAQWRKRQTALSGAREESNIFADDEPGLCAAYGAIKLVDSYDGPLVRLGRDRAPG